MTKQHSLLWTDGQSAAPLPPLADPASVAHEEYPMVALYRTYGPVFRLPQPGKEARIILAGPEANVFMARHEDEFFSTSEHWKQFDATITQQQWPLLKALSPQNLTVYPRFTRYRQYARAARGLL